MSITAFQRRRRMIAAQLAEQEAKALEEETNATEGENESQNATLTHVIGPEDIPNMDIEKVKEFLDIFNVKFAHNTGEDKLREKLKHAIG